MCPVVPEVAGSLNWCGTGSEFTRVACRVAVLNSFMMVDASPVTHIYIMPLLYGRQTLKKNTPLRDKSMVTMV